ncbi:MAG: response regulator transcription factor [Yoonia sp.]|uniref:response regulator transcription factor n=1 Tax=Yoonia sp. TaxID=2212373 RepID=UPI003EF72458
MKALTFSHGERNPLPGKTEKLVCALIAAVVTPPEINNWPTAAKWISAGLSTREKDVLHYLAAGLRNDAIASKLGIAEITVRVHITSARRKLGAATREQAIALAIQSGQLPL